MFQIAVMNGGGDEFNRLCYGNKHPATIGYLQQQMDNLSNVSSFVTDQMRGWFETARDTFNQFNSQEALRKGRALLNQITHVFQPDVIRELTFIEDIQQAASNMQRWIMACPQVRAMYHDQRCDGYSDTYVDMSPGDIADDHYDYRRVMQGMIFEGEKPDDDWKATIYLDELHEGDSELDITDQVDILTTWDHISMYLDRKESDPTSIWNSSL